MARRELAAKLLGDYLNAAYKEEFGLSEVSADVGAPVALLSARW